MFELLAKLFRKKQDKKPINNFEYLWEEWKQELERLKNHPISQMGLINSRVLTLIYESLLEINQKLDKLDLLDEMKEILIDLREKVSESDKKKIDQVLEKLEWEEKVIELIKKEGEINAEKLADLLNISRSNASYKLNRLYEKGILEKKIIGKKVFFYLK